MTVDAESVALVALLRAGRRRHRAYARLIERSGSARAVLESELGSDGRQAVLFPPGQPPGPDTGPSEVRESPDIGPPEARESAHTSPPEVREWLDAARRDVDEWLARGLRLVTVLDDGYPANLRAVDDHPPLLFIAGALEQADNRSIAVIGARRASADGLRLAATLASEFVRGGYTVASGLAAGIDTAAHEAALAEGGRTVAVIGNGLLRESYPPENAELQRQISARCAVVSQFWPGAPPSPKTFPMRNAVMSGLSRGSVLVEASERSGARVQARLALAHGRPVFLLERLLEQQWARDLARREGVHVVTCAQEVIAHVNRCLSGERTRE